MSGPKESSISIERRRQEELERQRKAEQARKERVNLLKNEIRQKLACFKNDAMTIAQRAVEVKKLAETSSLNLPLKLDNFIELKDFNKVKKSIDYETEDESLLKSYIENIQKETKAFNISKQHVVDTETTVSLQILKKEIREKLASYQKNSEILAQKAIEIKKLAESYNLNFPTELNSFIELEEFNRVKASINYDVEDENLLNSYIHNIQTKILNFNKCVLKLADCESSVRKEYCIANIKADNAQLIEKIRASQQAEQEKKEKVQEQFIDQRCLDLIAKAQKQFREISDDYTVEASIREKAQRNLNEFKATANENYLDFQSLSNIFAVKYSPIIKQLKQDNKLYQELFVRYNKILAQYQTLCEETGTAYKEFPVIEDSISLMQLEIQQLEITAKRRVLHNYIQKSINEIMVEMGYQVLGNGKATGYESKLYHFDEKCAVQVTMDSSGGLTMELGRLDDTDRNPEVSEKKELQHDMQNFCSKYKIIKDKLAQRGIALSNCVEYPPAEEYAQIFNVNDFNMDEEALESIASAEKVKHASVEMQKKVFG